MARDEDERSFVVNSSNDIRFCTSLDVVSGTALPLICPFNAGGYDDKGPSALSKRVWMEHALRTGRFASGDLGLKFHIVNQHEDAQRTKRLVTKKVMAAPGIVSDAGSVLITADELSVAAEDKIKKKFVSKEHRSGARVLLDATEVCMVFRHAYAFVAFPHSPSFTSQELCNDMLLTDRYAKKKRREAQAMVRAFGSGCFFVTWQMNATASKLVLRSFVEGNSGPLGMDALAAKSDQDILFEINDFLPAYTVLAFERFEDILVDKIFGWCRETNRSHSRGGLFGVTRAFINAIEQQSSEKLHGHRSVYLCMHCYARARRFSLYRDSSFLQRCLGARPRLIATSIARLRRTRNRGGKRMRCFVRSHRGCRARRAR